MGASPWDYFVPYREDIAAALKELKQQEFAADRYNKGWRGTTAASIAEAQQNAEADGTRSILDMEGIMATPHEPDSDAPQLGMVAPLSADQLVKLFGTDKPTRAQIEEAGGYPEWLDRGLSVYVIAYDGDTPSEIYFGGLSYD